MNAKQSEEVELVARFLAEIGRTAVHLKPADRPDVVAHIDGKHIGIEVTQFHGDEQPGIKGSSLRAEESKKVSNSGGRPYSVWGIADPMPALVARINEKISAAATYGHDACDEMWLLVSSQVPKVGATAATFAFAPFVDVTKLNKATHSQLSASPFSAAYFHLMMTHNVFCWSRLSGWNLPAATPNNPLHASARKFAPREQ